MSLIPYAGQDMLETASRSMRERLWFRAYELFDLGWDTWRIAKLLRVSEAKAERLVAKGRSRLA